MSYEPRLVEIHEAGHAVAALLLGIEVEAVSVVPDQDTCGRCVIAAGCFSTTDAAAFALGGLMAQCLAGYDSDEEANLAAADWREAREELAQDRQFRSEPRVKVGMRRCSRVAKTLLDQNWQAVLAVANALRLTPTLDGELVEDLVAEFGAEDALFMLEERRLWAEEER